MIFGSSISNLLGKTMCMWFGHRRGRRDMPLLNSEGGGYRYRCPRCSATWTRKARKPKAAKPQGE